MEKTPPACPQGVPLKPALRQAMEAMAAVNVPVTANKAGCEYSEGTILVPFFSRTFKVHVPTGRAEEAGSGAPPSPDAHLILLHYLLKADGTPPAGMWVTYRHIPDAMVFEPSFNAMAVEPLVRAFARDIGGFRAACESIGGIAMSRTGDASYRFAALPQIQMGCVLYLADEELAGSVSILFDAAAANYLCAEDIAFLGIRLSGLLLKAH